jgi:phosphatidylglycerol:prolipoprotein diacylglycerol transferase
MYLIAFFLGWWFGTMRLQRVGWTSKDLDDLTFYVVLGVILGGRVGYVLFYNFPVFLEDPLLILRIWQGGMSYHGGMLGVFIAMWLLGRKNGRGFFRITDYLAPLVPLGLGAGRIGNFINGELWGDVTDGPWGMVFPFVGPEPRHPTQLYEFALEGVLFFLILWIFSSRPRPLRAVSGLYLLCYGVFRFVIEFVRVPDEHLGYIAFDWLTMGQLLTLPMLGFGVLLLWLAYRDQPEAKA